MKKIIVSLVYILLVSCASTPLFFNGKVIGKYTHHFKDQMQCATVEGWYPASTCMCLVRDPRISATVFLVAPTEKWCEKNFEEGDQYEE